ncbi:FMN-dependent dehydrogenase-domain-containing protein [Tuber borchii]|uniref:L-lactate dehydrogenase (cytochrome) n=1 Tax=Tuber borchii TaxID=42251 RepID=A0A2T6ZSZ4_TUBBO|nr:FMN-dependent dehydrogenase-domain-containing protein [Tuber borchii]
MYTLKDVAAHSGPKDCWIIIKGTVYDVTEFLPQHPGGAEIILSYAGDDATGAYESFHPPSFLETPQPGFKPLGPLLPSELPISWKPEIKRQSKPPLNTIINTFDFEAIAERTVTPKTWAFYSSAATDLLSMKLNKKAFDQVLFRPRVMRNNESADTRTKILGFDTGVPFFIAPTAMQGMVNLDGEKAMAKGAREENVIQIISTNSSHPIADIVSSGKGPQKQTHFLQLYVNTDRQKTAQLLASAKACGLRAVFVTVDAHLAGKREADERLKVDVPVKSAVSGAISHNDEKGGGIGRLMGLYVDRTLNWEDIPWIKSVAGDLPIVLKGIQTAADAKLAVKYGVQGIVLSNHGGRSLDTSPPALYTLLEIHKIYPEVFNSLEVYIDGGIRRGTDIFKALCLGATAVGIGRPYLYALNYGAEGVAHLTQILKDELETTMRMCGVRDLSGVHPGLINTRKIDAFVEDGVEHSYVKWRPKSKI